MAQGGTFRAALCGEDYWERQGRYGQGLEAVGGG